MQAKNINLLLEALQEYINTGIQYFNRKSENPYYYFPQPLIDFAQLPIIVPKQKLQIPDWQDLHKFTSKGIEKPDGTELGMFANAERYIWENRERFLRMEILLKDGTILECPAIGSSPGTTMIVRHLNHINFDHCSEWKDVSDSMWKITSN
jgi:hypothetical protein